MIVNSKFALIIVVNYWIIFRIICSTKENMFLQCIHSLTLVDIFRRLWGTCFRFGVLTKTPSLPPNLQHSLTLKAFYSLAYTNSHQVSSLALPNKLVRY